MDRIELAKNVRIDSYLKSIGFTGEIVKSKNIKAFWRGGTGNSVSIDVEQGVWHDFSEGTGGDIIALVMRIQNCGFTEAVDILVGGNYATSSFTAPPEIKPKESKIHIIENKGRVQSYALRQYMGDRGIEPKTYDKWCTEVVYSVGDGNKQYYAVAFPLTGAKGYVLRNKYVKQCTKQSYSFVNTHITNKLLIFEGHCDMLSYDSVYPNTSAYLVLNSVVNKKHVHHIVEQYNNVELWLDNDNAGEEAVDYFKKMFPDITMTDMRYKYARFNDLNDCWVNFKKHQTI